MIYFYKKLLIIFISTLNLASILKGTLVMLIFLTSQFIMVKNNHFVSINFQNIRYYMLQILIVCLILKSIEANIEEDSNFSKCFNCILLFLVFNLQFGFIVYLLKFFFIFKVKNNLNFRVLLKKHAILKRLYRGNVINLKN